MIQQRSVCLTKQATLSSLYLLICLFFFSACNKPQTDATYYLLGERHGVAEQQLSIAEQLEALVSEDKKIAVVMEMIGEDQADLVSAFKKLYPEEPTDFGYAIGWDKTTWPDYELYAPIIDIIWRNDMHIGHGDASEADRARWRKGEWSAQELETILLERLRTDQSNTVRAAWAASVQKSHCGQLTDQEKDTLARAQMLRDAYMASQMQLLREQGYDTVVLIAGRSHVRRDRGVPLYLPPKSHSKTIAIVESESEKTEIGSYQPKSVFGDIKPYDQIILAPPIEKGETPCARLRRKGLIK